MELHEEIENDMWTWLHEFVSVSNEFYDFAYPPCPFARAALLGERVDVAVWQSGDVREFIRERSIEMGERPDLGTRTMVFPPRTQFAWGITDYVEALNAELIPDNVFLNTGVAKTTASRYPGSNDPYFMVVANSLDAVLRGSDALQKAAYYKDWPATHYEIVVERRTRMAERYGRERS